MQVPPPLQAVPLAAYTHAPVELQEVAPHTPVAQAVAQQSPAQTVLAHWLFAVQVTPLANKGAPPQTLATPLPPQVWPPMHDPQLSTSPQPSELIPQFKPCCMQFFGVQAAAPQTPAVPPPPQVWPLGQAPQLSVPPQPSAVVPQLMFCAAQVIGVQAPVPQTPDVHTPDLQAMPQPPQLLGSEAVLVQTLLHTVCPAEQVDAAHTPEAQFPL